MSLTISLGKWAELTPQEQDILTKVGIKPKETLLERRKRLFLEEYKPYTLAVYTKCSLCNSEFVQKFRMIPAFDNEQPYLKGKPLKNPTLILEDKRQDNHRPSCFNCRRVLAQKSKAELIRMLIKYAFYAAAFGGGK